MRVLLLDRRSQPSRDDVRSRADVLDARTRTADHERARAANACRQTRN